MGMSARINRASSQISQVGKNRVWDGTGSPVDFVEDSTAVVGTIG